MNQRQQYVTISLTLLCLLATGCNDGRPKRVPVSGQVLIDGTPLTTGAVRFHPESGRPSTGELDEQGRFSLFTFERGDGCTLGTHRVSVSSVESLNSTTERWNTPKHYASPSTSEITQTIDGPADDIVIELTWGNQEGPIIERIYGE